MMGSKIGPLGYGARIVTFFGQFGRAVELRVHVHGGGGDLHHAVGRYVHELRNVDGAVGSRGIVDQVGWPDCRSPCSSMWVKVHAGVRTGPLRRKHQPAAVRRPAMPRIHRGRVGIQSARRSSCGRNDVELAIGPHQLPVAALHKRRSISRPAIPCSRKELLIPFCEAPASGSATPSPRPPLNGTR